MVTKLCIAKYAHFYFIWHIASKQLLLHVATWGKWDCTRGFAMCNQYMCWGREGFLSVCIWYVFAYMYYVRCIFVYLIFCFWLFDQKEMYLSLGELTSTNTWYYNTLLFTTNYISVGIISVHGCQWEYFQFFWLG